MELAAREAVAEIVRDRTPWNDGYRMVAAGKPPRKGSSPDVPRRLCPVIRQRTSEVQACVVARSFVCSFLDTRGTMELAAREAVAEVAFRGEGVD